MDDNWYLVYLIKEYPGKRFAYIRIVVDTPKFGHRMDSHYRVGYKPYKTLNRTNMLYVVVNNNSSGKPRDGWYINHRLPHFNPEKGSPRIREVAQYIQSNGLILPSTAIAVGHSLTGKYQKRSYLTVRYNYNPEAEGFAPDKSTNWSYSDWQVNRVGQDPRKTAYIEKLKREHTVLHEKIKKGFGDVHAE